MGAGVGVDGVAGAVAGVGGEREGLVGANEGVTGRLGAGGDADAVGLEDFWDFEGFGDDTWGVAGGEDLGGGYGTAHGQTEER